MINSTEFPHHSILLIPFVSSNEVASTQVDVMVEMEKVGEIVNLATPIGFEERT